MGKAKKRITTAFAVVMIGTIIILLIYLEWSQRSSSKKVASENIREEVQSLLEKDLELYYPETPREAARLHGQMTKALYSGIGDEEIEALAKKIRLLYDGELLENNPEDKYLKDLYSEIAAWNKAERKITNYLIVNEDLEVREVIDGREYATVYVSFTITDQGKRTELRKYLLRSDEDGRWKVLGWEVIPEEKK